VVRYSKALQRVVLYRSHVLHRSHTVGWARLLLPQDVVLLQEVWVDTDVRLLMAAGKAAGLVHGVHFRSGMFGSGLVTMSRHPITELGFWLYAAAGNAHAVVHGDFYAGKGELTASLVDNDNQPVELLQRGPAIDLAGNSLCWR